MKKYVLLGALTFFGLLARAQSKEVKEVKETVLAFAKAGDAQDAELLGTYLDEHYRVVMNRLFGNTELVVMTREVYLAKIRNKEFGGDTRTLVFHDIQVNGQTAVVRVRMEGSKLTLESTLLLTQDTKGKWRLVCDVPIPQ
jgi:ketosteroid isomerase-like protein